VSYLAKQVRQKEDILNYTASGALNGAVVGYSFGGGYKRGLVGLVGGSIAGAFYSASTDFVHGISRTAWIKSRRNKLMDTRQRQMVVRKPVFPKMKDRFVLSLGTPPKEVLPAKSSVQPKDSSAENGSKVDKT
jgi:uncharacterized protein YcfJ